MEDLSCPSTEVKYLLSILRQNELSARLWAATYCWIFAENPKAATDVDYMTGVFLSAIQAGYNEGYHRGGENERDFPRTN